MSDIKNMPSIDHDPSDHDQLTATWVELTIRLGVLGLLLYLSFLLVRPFISIAIWSVVLTVALYPVYDWIVDLLGGRRRLAAALLTSLSLLIVIGPATWLVLGLIDSLRILSERFDLSALALPPPPESVKSWPLIGDPIYQFWDLASTNLQAALAKIAPHLKPIGSSLLQIAADAGTGAIKFFIAIVDCGISVFASARAGRCHHEVLTQARFGARRGIRPTRRGHHSSRVAWRDRHFGSAGVPCWIGPHGRRNSRRQPDHLRGPYSRNHSDRPIDRSHPADHLELDGDGNDDGLAVHRLHDPGQSAGQCSTAACHGAGTGTRRCWSF